VACEFVVASGVVVFSLVFRELARSRMMGALSTIFLLTPPVIFAANMVRMEAPLFLLISVALLLHLKGYKLAAGSLLVGSLLLHPALGLAAIAYVLTAFWARGATPLARSLRRRFGEAVHTTVDSMILIFIQ
jgi:hypothetical protein